MPDKPPAADRPARPSPRRPHARRGDRPRRTLDAPPPSAPREEPGGAPDEPPPPPADEPAPVADESPAPAPGEAPPEGAAGEGLPAAEPVGADLAAGLAKAILIDAVRRGADHVHFEPGRDGLAVKLRIDGVLQERGGGDARLPRSFIPELMAYLRSRAGVRDSAGGSWSSRGPHLVRPPAVPLTVAGRQVELRFSVLRTAFGEKAVVNILDPAASPAPLADLHLPAADEAAVRAMLSAPSGLVALAAPIRGGRWAGLGAAVAELAAPQRSVVVAAQHLAARIGPAAMLAVEPGAGFGFAEAIAAAAAADADAIVVEDVHSPAAASAALSAALDGRMVVAGMSCAAAPEAVALLVEMGLDGVALSLAFRGAVALRRVRRLCDECKRAAPAASGGEAGAFVPRGCARCSGTGFVGFVALASTLPARAELVEWLRSSAAADDVRQAASEMVSRSLDDAAAAALREGLTSPAEVARVR